MVFPIVFISTPDEINMSGKSSGVFLTRFLPGGISILTANGRCFSGIVGTFSEINLL